MLCYISRIPLHWQSYITTVELHYITLIEFCYVSRIPVHYICDYMTLTEFHYATRIALHSITRILLHSWKCYTMESLYYNNGIPLHYQNYFTLRELCYVTLINRIELLHNQNSVVKLWEICYIIFKRVHSIPLLLLMELHCIILEFHSVILTDFLYIKRNPLHYFNVILLH